VQPFAGPRRRLRSLFKDNRDTGGFILIDKISNSHGRHAGMIHFALRRSSNVHWQALDVERTTRAADQGTQAGGALVHRPLRFRKVDHRQHRRPQAVRANGAHTMMLDGDNVRHGLNKDLGFTDADRVENIRRVGEVAKLMTDAGLITLVSFISPFRAERRMARDMMATASSSRSSSTRRSRIAEQRDVKGLYKKARAGVIKNFTGIDSPYEPPENPEVRVDTTSLSAEEAADEVLRVLAERSIVSL
jgi:bifunctional enzyme CysN/CysC